MSVRALARAAVLLSAIVSGIAAGPVGRSTAGPTRARLWLSATAYCNGGTTQSGTRARTGIVAADPQLLPIGSVVRIDQPHRYAGIYTVMDTGPAVRGRALDIFIPNCTVAGRFGRQLLSLRILRRGWNPKASVPEE